MTLMAISSAVGSIWAAAVKLKTSAQKWSPTILVRFEHTAFQLIGG